MPKRVIDFDAMWGSDKLASCAEWAQAEYAWLYGLADASGCFELTNLRVVWGRVAAIRRNLTLERLEQIFNEFQDKGLLFAWEENGKRYAHWTGSDVPGRLPPPSWRVRLERLAPAVPKQQFAEYMSRFSCGRASSPGGGFHVAPSEGAAQAPLKPPFDRGLNAGLEAAQAQDWNWNQKENWKESKKGFEQKVRGEGNQQTSHKRGIEIEPTQSEQLQPALPNLNSNSRKPEPGPAQTEVCATHTSRCHSAASSRSGHEPHGAQTGVCRTGTAPEEAVNYARYKSLLVTRELKVGEGPSCGPAHVRPEVLERVRARNASRSP
jgi:hypothetical protein